MAALLKALGVVVWSLAAVGLLIIGGMIAFRSFHAAPVERPRAALTVSTDPSAATPSALSVHRPSERAARDGAASGPSRALRDAFDPTFSRIRFREAATHRDLPALIDYGRQLDDHGLAGPEELSRVALAFYTIGDCPNALAWIDKAAVALAGQRPDPALGTARAKCRREPSVSTALSGASGSSGDHDVHTGELFYGFNDYSRAVAFLRKGLDTGGVTHADEAYVYLGLSYLALHQNVEACAAFDALKDVPDVSPRVVRLWSLFADMRCMRTASD